MKNVISTIILFVLSMFALAQVPEGINYQAVARNTSGNVLATQTITVRLTKDEPAPYIHVRAGLNALIDRKSFYRMIELGCHEVQQDGQSWFGLWSKGQFFKVIPSADLS